MEMAGQRSAFAVWIDLIGYSTSASCSSASASSELGPVLVSWIEWRSLVAKKKKKKKRKSIFFHF